MSQNGSALNAEKPSNETPRADRKSSAPKNAGEPGTENTSIRKTGNRQENSSVLSAGECSSQSGMTSVKENTAHAPVRIGRGRGKEKPMKHFYEKETQCRSEEDRDVVLERGADGKVQELTDTEEAENDAGNDPKKQ